MKPDGDHIAGVTVLVFGGGEAVLVNAYGEIRPEDLGNLVSIPERSRRRPCARITRRTAQDSRFYGQAVQRRYARARARPYGLRLSASTAALSASAVVLLLSLGLRLAVDALRQQREPLRDRHEVPFISGLGQVGGAGLARLGSGIEVD